MLCQHGRRQRPFAQRGALSATSRPRGGARSCQCSLGRSCPVLDRCLGETRCLVSILLVLLQRRLLVVTLVCLR